MHGVNPYITGNVPESCEIRVHAEPVNLRIPHGV